MPILALSRIDPSSLKPSIRLGLLVLPLVISVALSFPAYLLVEQILPAIGIDPDVPLKGQSRDGLGTFLLIGIVMAGFIGGYIVGFFANAAVCKVFLSWTKNEVVAVFFRSEIPPRWFKSD